MAQSPTWRSALATNNLTKDIFTQLFADALRERLPSHEVLVVGDLEIRVRGEPSSVICHLNNAWGELSDDWEDRLSLFERHLRSTVEMLQVDSESAAKITTLNQVLPLIKDDLFFTPDDDSLKEMMAKLWRAPLVEDLHVLLVADREYGLSFLTRDQVGSFGLSDENLLRRAINNLDQKLPGIERHGNGPVYMLTCGGTYEASLLLMTDIWTAHESFVSGELVACVPTRDILYFTGSDDRAGIEWIQEKAEELHTNESYLVSQTLIVRRAGAWLKFEV